MEIAGSTSRKNGALTKIRAEQFQLVRNISNYAG